MKYKVGDKIVIKEQSEWGWFLLGYEETEEEKFIASVDRILTIKEIRTDKYVPTEYYIVEEMYKEVLEHFDNEMVYYIDNRHYGKNYSTNTTEIAETLSNKHNSILKLFNENNVKHPKDTPDFIKYLAVFNTHEKYVSVMNLTELFDKYLEMCNYKKTEEDIDFNEFEFDSFIEPGTPYKDIKEITNSVCKALIIKKKNIPLTEEESLQVEKFQFQFYLLNRPFEIEEGLWKIYTNKKIKHHVKFSKNRRNKKV